MNKTRKNGEVFCDFRVLSTLFGGRSLGILTAIIADMEPNGSSRVNWSHYRLVSGVTPQNLQPVLKGFEQKGLICRDVRDTWALIWVNPLVFRHLFSKDDYTVNKARRFFAKRKSVLVSLGIDMSTFDDPCSMMEHSLPTAKPTVRFTIDQTHQRTRHAKRINIENRENSSSQINPLPEIPED